MAEQIITLDFKFEPTDDERGVILTLDDAPEWPAFVEFSDGNEVRRFVPKADADQLVQALRDIAQLGFIRDAGHVRALWALLAAWDREHGDG